MSSILYYVLLFSFLFACVCQTSALSNGVNEQFYLCGATKSGYALRVPTEVKCKTPQLSRVKHVTVELFVPRSTPYVVDAHRCHVRTGTVCTRTSFFGGKGLVSDTSGVESIPSSECWRVKQTGQWKDKKLIQQSEGLWTSENHPLVSYTWCCYDACNSVSNLILEQGQIATLDGELANSDIGDISACKLSAGICHTLEGVVLWDEHLFGKPLCKFEKKPGVFEATVADKHLVIDKLQAAFSFSGERAPECVGKNAVLMDQGVAINLLDYFDEKTDNKGKAVNTASIFWLNLLPDDLKHMVPKPNDTKKTDILTYDAYNSRYEYLEQKFLRIEAEGFREIWNSLCMLASR